MSNLKFSEEKKGREVERDQKLIIASSLCVAGSATWLTQLPATPTACYLDRRNVALQRVWQPGCRRSRLTNQGRSSVPAERNMRSARLVLVGLIAGVATTIGAQQVLSEVDSANQRFGDAARSRDTETYAQLVADDAEFVAPTGTLIDKSTRIAQIKEGAVAPVPVIFRERPGYHVRMYGETAVISWQDPPAGGRNGQRVVRVFVRQSGAWRLVHYQRTFIAAP